MSTIDIVELTLNSFLVLENFSDTENSIAMFKNVSFGGKRESYDVKNANDVDP